MVIISDYKFKYVCRLDKLYDYFFSTPINIIKTLQIINVLPYVFNILGANSIPNLSYTPKSVTSINHNHKNKIKFNITYKIKNYSKQ